MTQEGQPAHVSEPAPHPPSSGPAQPPPPPVAPAPQGAQPAAGVLAPVPPPPRDAWRQPRRVESVPGTPFGVVHLDVPPVVSGPAVGSLVAGVGSVLISLAVACLGLVGVPGGWGGWAAGAFAILGSFLGLAAVALGLLGRWQTGRLAPPPAVRFTGRGLAFAGMICGAVGFGITVLAFAAVLLLQLL